MKNKSATVLGTPYGEETEKIERILIIRSKGLEAQEK